MGVPGRDPVDRTVPAVLGDPGPRRAGFEVTAAALIGSGVLVVVLLAIVARSVTAPEFALFSTFWSVALVAGFGVFLPVEQWLAGRRPPDGRIAADVVQATPLVLAMAAVEAVVLIAVGGELFWSLGGGAGMLAAVAALCAVSGAQFLARGCLIGAQRLTLFAAVLVLDVVVRVGIVLVLSGAGVTTATPYAWAVVVGIGVVHVPVLLVILARGDTRIRWRSFGPARPILLLLIGSLGAQVLFNGPSVALSAVASRADLAEVATFQAAFQLVRVPLFLAIPLQATLVPVMTRVLHGKERRERAALLLRFAATVLALVGVGTATGWVLGPWLVQLIFGAQYDASRTLVAVLAAGAAAYLGLLVLSQAFVADDRHRTVGASWGAGVVVAAVVFVAVPGDVLAASLAFTGGCVAGLAWAMVASLRARNRPVTRAVVEVAG